MIMLMIFSCILHVMTTHATYKHKHKNVVEKNIKIWAVHSLNQLHFIPLKHFCLCKKYQLFNFDKNFPVIMIREDVAMLRESPPMFQ